MAERDYAKEYEREKKYKKMIGVTVTPQISEAFTKKIESDGTSKNAFLKSCIMSYINNEITIDEYGKICTVE